MKESFYLASQYLWFHKGRTSILALALALIFTLPLTLKQSLNSFETKLRQRAESTPLLIGKKGRPYDLVLHNLYFQGKGLESISYSESQKIDQEKLTESIPLFLKFTARKFPILGTSSQYLPFREATYASGVPFLEIGECVLGADVAESLKLKVGDSIVSDSSNAFSLTGAYPLKMKVVGVLNKQNSPDDSAVFCDIESTWIMAGIGHGHQDVKNHSKEDNNIRVYNEVTERNKEDFHFHGDKKDFPISAIIILPKDERNATFLEDRIRREGAVQLYRPGLVINDLLKMVFKIETMIQMALTLVYLSSSLFFILIFSLNFKLRAKERQTLCALGCSRTKIFQVHVTELLLIFLYAFIIVVITQVALSHAPDEIMWELLKN